MIPFIRTPEQHSLSIIILIVQIENHVLLLDSVIEITCALCEFEIGVHDVGVPQGRGCEEGYVAHEGKEVE